MSENIEIEYKVLLTEEQFKILEVELPFPEHPIIQINHYFDTFNFLLKSYHSSVRIREIDKQYTLTLKQPKDQHILETNDYLTEKEFISWLNGDPIAKHHTSKRLAQLGIVERELTYFGSLQTERKEFSSQQISYCLDKSSYNGITDYELELEVPEVGIGETIFDTLLEKYTIQKTKPITKIERFFKTLTTDQQSNQLPFQ